MTGDPILYCQWMIKLRRCHIADCLPNTFLHISALKMMVKFFEPGPLSTAEWLHYFNDQFQREAGDRHETDNQDYGLMAMLSYV